MSNSISRIERIALIGYGAIGSRVHRLIQASKDVELVAILLPPGSRTLIVPAYAALSSLFCTELDQLLERKPGLVVECAGHSAVDSCANPVLASGSDLMLVSVGALASAKRYDDIVWAAQAYQRQLLLPAGAIAGIDWLAASRRSGLHEVTYRSRKPPAAWLGTPAGQLLDLHTLKGEHCFFRGNARDAALMYPKNANVAATVALAGLGFERTSVELIADANAAGNIHEIQARGNAGELHLSVLGHADPENPKTSLLTAYSIVRSIENRSAALSI